MYIVSIFIVKPCYHRLVIRETIGASKIVNGSWVQLNVPKREIVRSNCNVIDKQTNWIGAQKFATGFRSLTSIELQTVPYFCALRAPDRLARRSIRPKHL